MSLGGTTPPGEGAAPGGTTPPTQQVIDLTSEPTIPTLGPLVPAFDRVPIEQAREAMRGYIALALVLTVGGIILGCMLLLGTKSATAADLKDVMSIVFTPIVALLGAVVGFYYGTGTGQPTK